MELQMQKDNFMYINRQDVNSFPFPYKLWLIVNSETCDSVKWNIDGTEIEIKIIALDEYLSSPKSIFQIKDITSFTELLRCFGFEKLVADSSGIGLNVPPDVLWSAYSEFKINFKHENFLRHRIDLLAKIRKVHEIAVKTPNGRTNRLLADRMEGDLCFKSFEPLSEVQKARIKYQTIVKFQSETQILQEKLQASELRTGVKNQEDHGEETMIELPAEMFENPHDSVLYMGDEHREVYAGFYGNCSKEQIIKFFGDYLPMYENANDADGEKRIIGLNPSPRSPSQQPISYEMEFSLDEASGNTTEQQASSQPLSSSALQPIFIPDEDKEEISMDDFIKFKEHATVPEASQSSNAPKIKMEILEKDDDNENEANFKNFFSQYRESLSLLYEKQ